MPDGSLVPRNLEGALIKDEAEIINRVIRMVKDKEVVAIDGSIVSIQADTLCLHGDGENAVLFASTIRRALEEAGVSVLPIGSFQERMSC